MNKNDEILGTTIHLDAYTYINSNFLTISE